MCVLCVCACWQTRAVCVHGVGAQRLRVRHGSECVCVCVGAHVCAPVGGHVLFVCTV